MNKIIEESIHLCNLSYYDNINIMKMKNDENLIPNKYDKSSMDFIKLNDIQICINAKLEFNLPNILYCFINKTIYIVFCGRRKNTNIQRSSSPSRSTGTSPDTPTSPSVPPSSSALS